MLMLRFCGSTFIMYAAQAGSTPAAEDHVPRRRDAVRFRCKATLLQVRRAAQDTARGVRRHPAGALADFPHVLAESRTPLWGDCNAAERALQQGKVQNLRCAVRRLQNTVVPADGVFSFWKQVGRATAWRGYVPGRLLREA
jgi:vancomycin resistance protein YoaR